MAGQFDLKWQPVQASDASRLLAVSQEATEAYDKAVKDQIKVFDTMFNNAQQHKMNEVQQAVNAFSLEDYNAPDARAKFDEIVANASQGIGGLNAANQLVMDSVWDKRGDTLVNRETDKLNLESLGLAVGDKRDADTITNFGQTRAAMRAEIDRVNKLPQSPERDALLGQLELSLADYETAFKTSHPDLWIRGDNATVNATTSQREAKVAAVDTENKLYDSMVNGMYPQFSAYAEAHKEVLDRYGDVDSISDAKEKATKTAERDAALAKVSTQFKDVDTWLKDPRMMASLNKRWQQELDAAANDALKREEILAKINATYIGAQADLTRAGAAVTTAEANAARAANEIIQDGVDASNKQAEQAAEFTKETLKASAKTYNIPDSRVKAILGKDGKINNAAAVTELNRLGGIFQEEYNLGAPKASTDFARWVTSNSATYYRKEFEARTKANPELKNRFDVVTKNMSQRDKTLLYIGMATQPMEEVEKIIPVWYRTGSVATNTAKNLINIGSKTFRERYMADATSIMSRHIEWVATSQGMTSQDWLKANRANLGKALAFQSSTTIADQIGSSGTDNWNKIPNTNNIKKNPPVDKGEALSVGAAMGITF